MSKEGGKAASKHGSAALRMARLNCRKRTVRARRLKRPNKARKYSCFFPKIAVY